VCDQSDVHGVVKKGEKNNQLVPKHCSDRLVHMPGDHGLEIGWRQF